MLSVLTGVRLNPDDEVLATEAGNIRWRDILEAADRFEGRNRDLAGRRVGLRFRPTPECFAALVALERMACDLFLMSGIADEDQLADWAMFLKLGAVLAQRDASDAGEISIRPFSGEAPGTGRSTVALLTSGTSGRPKAVRHTWSSLARPVRVDAAHPAPRWLLTYQPHLYAGLQVILQCFVNAGRLICPGIGAGAQRIASLARDAGAQFGSATPSFWRWLLTFAEHETLRRIPLIQITLGGEIVPQELLDALHERFPTARLVHIYATTELGRCFSVTDGRAGFPARFLEGPSPDGIEMRIDGDELLVRSANSMLAYDAAANQSAPSSDFFRTGDLVKVQDSRVYFVGRKTDIINVGGNKVHPAEVEQIVQSVPGVQDVRVFARTSSIAGQLVACEIVPMAQCDAQRIREAVQAACVSQLAPYQRPRFIDIVDKIHLSDASKKKRGVAT